MMDTIIQIMVEVLTILGIATKEMKQGRISKQSSMSMSPVTEGCPEKYGKRLIGRTDMEDALKRLEKLTHEEARMAIAENLRATHAVDERVTGVTEQVLVVDDRVAGVNDRLANVDDRVANVDDKVANVNDKVTEVIHGVCKSFSVLRNIQPELLRWKGSTGSFGTNGQRCRSSETFVVSRPHQR
jgi:hypothetical protein